MNEPKLIAGRSAARAQWPSGREGRSRRRIGILSFSSPGHYYPLTALGRGLQSRGHEVVYFQVADLERPIRAAGLEFRQIGQEDFPLGALRARDEDLPAFPFERLLKSLHIRILEWLVDPRFDALFLGVGRQHQGKQQGTRHQETSHGGLRLEEQRTVPALRRSYARDFPEHAKVR